MGFCIACRATPFCKWVSYACSDGCCLLHLLCFFLVVVVPCCGVQFRIPSAYTNSEYAVGVVGTALSVVGCVPDRDVVVDTTDWLHNYSEAIRREQQGVLWVGLLWPPRYTGEVPREEARTGRRTLVVVCMHAYSLCAHSWVPVVVLETRSQVRIVGPCRLLLLVQVPATRATQAASISVSECCTRTPRGMRPARQPRTVAWSWSGRQQGGRALHPHSQGGHAP